MEETLPVRSIPPTPSIRERLGQLVRESILTRRLLRLAEQRDKLAPAPNDTHERTDGEVSHA